VVELRRKVRDLEAKLRIHQEAYTEESKEGKEAQ
jgi:hypothetical protein